MHPMFICRVCLILSSLVGHAKVPSWTTWAKRFTGESDSVRKTAIQKLQQIKDLEKQLIEALQGPQRFLALEVIATLKLESLRRPVMAIADGDDSSVYFVTLNSLYNSDNQKELTSFYIRELVEKKNAPAQVVILDTLARMDYVLDDDLIRGLIKKNSSPEFQQALLGYFRLTHVHFSSKALRAWFDQIRKSKAYQVRAQLLLLVSESPSLVGNGSSWVTEFCSLESHLQVRSLCQRIAGRKLQ